MMKWLKQKTSINSKDSASNSNNLELGQSIKSLTVTKLVTLKDINSLMKTALVCLFVISCGQQSGIEKHGEDYYHTKKIKFDNKGELPKTIKEEPRYVPVKDKGTEEVIEIEPVSEDRIELIEDLKKGLDNDLTVNEEDISFQQAQWAKENIIGIHKKLGKMLYFVGQENITLTIKTKNKEELTSKSYINYNLSYEDVSVFEESTSFTLNDRETTATITCRDEMCEESSIQLKDTKTGKKFTTLYSGTENYDVKKEKASKSESTEIDFIDIITPEEVKTIEIAKYPEIETPKATDELQKEDIEVKDKDTDTPPKKKEDDNITAPQKEETEEDTKSPAPTLKPSTPKSEDTITQEDFDEVIPQAPKTKPSKENNFIWPIDTSEIRTNSPFGDRFIDGKKKPHKGMDFDYPRGTPVISIGDGIVERSDNKMRGFGNQVTIKYKDSADPDLNYYVVYAHLKTPSKLKKGEYVKQGQKVGEIGNSGLNIKDTNSGNHLHLTVYKKRFSPSYKINPMEILNYRSDLKCHTENPANKEEYLKRCEEYHNDHKHDHSHDLNS